MEIVAFKNKQNTIHKMSQSFDPVLIRKAFRVFYLAFALVFVQGVPLHMHTYDHDPASSDHTHQGQLHFNHDTLETGHPDEVAEIGLSQQGLLKSFSLGSLIIVVFVTVIVFFSSRLLSQVPWPPDLSGLLAALLFELRPPLRAPPL